MGIYEKLAEAKKTTWLADGLSVDEIKTTVELAKISATIERRRVDLGMTQVEFADYMGVSQGMVSKWESREYNFTIKSLNEICKKLNLTLSVELEMSYDKDNYIFYTCNKDRVSNAEKYKWLGQLNDKEAIA